MRNRYFAITDSMLAAGAGAMWKCHERGGHNAQSVCRSVFEAMLNAAYTHPGRPDDGPRPRGVLMRERRSVMPLLDGKRLPMTIWHPDDFPAHRLARCDYWYLYPKYDVELRNLLRNPANRAKLKFHKPA